MIIYEFFSGIGGMHQGLSMIPEIQIKQIYPFDINPNANATYTHNFAIKPFEMSIENFSIEDYEFMCAKDNVDVDNNLIWVMSPPCQPFTRQGNEKDLEDTRTCGFKHLMDILASSKYIPNYLLLENVKNFENSEANDLLLKTLLDRGYHINQFLLSPTQFGIPNSRLRFYLLARGPNEKAFPVVGTDLITNPEVLLCIEKSVSNSSSAGMIQDENGDESTVTITVQIPDIKTFLSYDIEKEQYNQQYYLSQKILEKESSNSMDIVVLESTNSNCFTKNYTRLFKGTGSILLLDSSLFKSCIPLAEYAGYLRFFTPEEIMKFMCFHPNFSFPDTVSVKSRYKLLGNSVNVKIINILLKYLFLSN